jgi:hypothetical protein
MRFPLVCGLPNCHCYQNLNFHRGKIISDLSVPYILAFDLYSITKGEVLVHAMKVHRWRRGTAPLILNPGTRWRKVVNFTHQLLYLWERTPVSIE